LGTLSSRFRARRGWDTVDRQYSLLSSQRPMPYLDTQSCHTWSSTAKSLFNHLKLKYLPVPRYKGTALLITHTIAHRAPRSQETLHCGRTPWMAVAFLFSTLSPNQYASLEINTRRHLPLGIWLSTRYSSTLYGLADGLIRAHHSAEVGVTTTHSILVKREVLKPTTATLCRVQESVRFVSQLSPQQ